MPSRSAASTSNRPGRRWLQFSLRTLLFSMLLLSCALGWYAERARRQREALSKIIRYGGEVTYDYQLDFLGQPRRDKHGNFQHGLQPPGPRWLRELVGDDYFRAPVKVWLEIDEGVGFEDRDLQALAGALQSLPTLRTLSLRGSPITDAGLAHLHGLTQVREFDCMWTNVTDEGIDALQEALPRCHVTR